MCWKVERWGGNANHKRRTVFIGSEDLARKRYHEIYLKLRQGIVALIDNKGVTVKQYGSGRGRSTGNIVEF